MEHPILFDAAANGHLQQLKAMMHKEPSMLHATTAQEKTLLFEPMAQGRVGVVRFLLKQGGLDINHRDVKSKTALEYALDHRARLSEQAEVLVLVVETGAEYSEQYGLVMFTNAAREGLTHRESRLVRTLEAGVDPTRVSMWSRSPLTALRVAMVGSHTDCVQHVKEWERTYILAKARRLRDASLTRTLTISTIAAGQSRLKKKLTCTEGAPPYLKHRMRWSRRALPRVESDFLAADAHAYAKLAEDGGEGGEVNRWKKAALVALVMSHVMEQLQPDLATDLLGVLGASDGSLDA